MGDGVAEGSSAMGDGGQAAISLMSDVDGTGSSALLTILPLCHLPPTLPAQSLIFLACSLRANPCVSAVVLYFSRYLYCKIYFFVCFLMCYLCESYL